MPIPASANFVLSVASVLISISTSPPATPALASQLAGAIDAGIAGWKTSGCIWRNPKNSARVVITFIDRNGP